MMTMWGVNDTASSSSLPLWFLVSSVRTVAVCVCVSSVLPDLVSPMLCRLAPYPEDHHPPIPPSPPRPLPDRSSHGYTSTAPGRAFLDAGTRPRIRPQCTPDPIRPLDSVPGHRRRWASFLASGFMSYTAESSADASAYELRTVVVRGKGRRGLPRLHRPENEDDMPW